MPPTSARRPGAVRLGALLGLLAAAPVAASPLEFISPRDPIVAELRVLECYDLPADSGRFRLPHLGSLPLVRLELMGAGGPWLEGNRSRTLVSERIERELERDAVGAFGEVRARRSTPRMWQR